MDGTRLDSGTSEQEEAPQGSSEFESQLARAELRANAVYLQRRGILVHVCDVNGTLLRLNDGLCQFLDLCSPQEVCGCPVSDVFGAPYNTQALDAILGIVAGGDGHTVCPEELVSPDGVRRQPVTTTRIPMREADGRILGVAAYSTPIAEPPVLYDALDDSQDWFRVFMERLPTPVFIKDENLRYVYGNQFMRERFALADWLGKTALEYHPGVLGEQLYHDDETALQGGPVAREEWVPNKDGEMRCHRTFKFPIPRENRPPLLGGISIDLTEQRRTQEALKESETRYRTLYDTAPLAFVLWDATGRIVDWNRGASRLFGWSRDEVVGRDFLSLLFVEPERMGIEFRELTTGGGVSASATCENQDRDGRRLVCEWNNSVRRDPRGHVSAVLSIALDITERLRAEEDRRRLDEQVQQAQKLESLGVLAGGIAHDFNNILMGVLGNADLARSALPEDSPLRGHLNAIDTSARRAADLCRQMLAYSGQGQFLLQLVSINQAIEEMRSILEAALSKKASIELALTPGLPSIKADAMQLRQIIVNLVTNASEALDEQRGLVSVRTGVMVCDRAYLDTTYLKAPIPEGDYVYLEVQDTGCGMDDETLQKLFEPFYTTKFAGRGLGMAAVLGIIRAHHGAIHVDSRPGEGTTMRVLFPATRPTVKTGKESLTQLCGELENVGNTTILLVDDEKIVRDVGSRMLEKAGFAVLIAEDGEAGLDVFEEHKDAVGCVLLDLTMPKMDGEEAFRRMRSLKPDLPVLFSSGFNEQDITAKFEGEARVGFVAKPYKFADLVEKLRSLLCKS